MIYLDHAATTPLDRRVADAAAEAAVRGFANPSSLHEAGRRARAVVDAGRARVAALLNADPGEIVFTAGGTEADNLALIGAIEAAGPETSHIVTSAFEHPAVLTACRHLETRGASVTRLPVGSDGIVDPEALSAALRPTTRLVSIMAANNVVGTIQPIAELARRTREHGALFHTDAVQAAGKIPLDLARLPIDLLSLSAHKFHGPKGVGALYVRSGTRLAPIVHGGGQERGLRSSTENVAGIAGFGVAADLARREAADDAVRLVAERDRLIDGVLDTVPGAYLIGDRHLRLPGHVCLGFAGREGEAIKLLLALDEAGIAVSSGSACSSSHVAQPSHVLTAMGFDPLRARGSLRITLGRFTTSAEIDRLLEVLPVAARGLRSATTRA